MCGIAGFLGAEYSEDSAIDKLKKMAAAMQQRGPDDEGIFLDSAANIGLVHRRLSIIDLSSSGHQPMMSSDGRYVIVFNGEMYNFAKIRTTLEADGVEFRGSSDTEVLLNAILKWGLDGALKRAIGMFAFALWDKNERVLYLARDRLGEKPLYLVKLRRGIAFASDLSAIRNADIAQLGVDQDALALYLKYAYVPAPHAIYADSEKIMPGTVLAISESNAAPKNGASWERKGRHATYHLFVNEYWSPRTIPAEQVSTPAQAQDEFNELLLDSVSMQHHADVPVGAFLSGGIDSSLICAVAQSVSNKPINTFTMGYSDALFDESKYAEAVAKKLGTNHTCVKVSSDDAIKWIPRIAEIYDEPFADPSQLPTFLVSQIASRDVKVCLTGDGGDELFGGYNRYIEPIRIQRKLSKIPGPLVNATAALLRRVPAGSVDAAVSWLAQTLNSKRLRVQSPGRKLHKLADMVTTASPKDIYENFMSHWRRPNDLLVEQVADPSLFNETGWLWEDYAENAMLWDIEHYLPDNNLAKVDRASMAVSLETRLPLLDHRIVELSRRTPDALKISGGAGKLILRNSLNRFLPRDLIDRPKMGFSVPIAAWLRGPLREWAEDLLSLQTIRSIGLFNADAVTACWQAHLSGRNDNYMKLWLVIVAHAWVRSNQASTARS